MRAIPSLLVAGFLLIVAVPAQTSGPTGEGCNLSGWRLFIDPGHGGTDPGAIGPTGLQEKEVTLDVGLQLRDWLQFFGAKVAMSRMTDIFVPLTTRAELANNFGADRFSSIHMNAFTDPAANGTETYVVPNPRPVTMYLGHLKLKFLLWYLGLRDRGLRFASFTVLVQTRMPASLSESAFISNPAEEMLLRDPGVRSSIAEAHALALCESVASSERFTDPSSADTEPWITQPSANQPADVGALRVTHIIQGDRPLVAPRFSSDGTFVTFGESGSPSSYVADLNNARVTRAPASVWPEPVAAGPQGAPYIEGGQLWVNRDGTSTEVTNDELVYFNPVLSPMGDRVLVTASDRDRSSLLVIDLRTRERWNLSVLGTGRVGDANLGYEGAWSPDGSRVLFSLTRDDGHVARGSDLYVTDADGQNLRRLS
ncbi:MAG: N-acetylmuramoyl-L-alanine amidase, partial [Acidimicrobiia bacterium]